MPSRHHAHAPRDAIIPQTRPLQIGALGDSPPRREAGWPAQPKLAKRAKAGGGRRTRTFEVIRRLIYSQLPLPLGTLPRPNSIGTRPLNGGGRAMDDVDTVSRWRAPGRPRLWAKRHGKVNQCRPRNSLLKRP